MPFWNNERGCKLCPDFSRDNLFEVVKRRSRKNVKVESKSCDIVCNRSKMPASTLMYTKTADKIHRAGKSKRIDCPFFWYIGRKISSYFITIKSNMYKHVHSQVEQENHALHKRLTDEQKVLVSTMLKAGTPPSKMILNSRVFITLQQPILGVHLRKSSITLTECCAKLYKCFLGTWSHASAILVFRSSVFSN